MTENKLKFRLIFNHNIQAHASIEAHFQNSLLYQKHQTW